MSVTWTTQHDGRTKHRLSRQLERNVARQTHAHTTVSKSLDGDEGISRAAAAETSDCVELGLLRLGALRE
jgi:hypothetical protein